jgi:hypothetical protein
MKTETIKDVLLGGIRELMNNRHYYYRSSIAPAYSNWTEEGKQAIIDFVVAISQEIESEELRMLDEHAKQLVLKGLKDSV